MTTYDMTESIDTELINQAMQKIMDDLNKSAIMYTSEKTIDYDVFYQEMQVKSEYLNQLDVQFHDYWYYIARNILNGVKPTNQEINNLHEYAYAIMNIKW